MAAGTKKRPIEALAIAVQIAMLAAAPTRTEYTVPKTSAHLRRPPRGSPGRRQGGTRRGGRRPSPRLAAPVTLPPAVGAQPAGVRLKSDT